MQSHHAMSNEPPSVTRHSTVSNIFDAEQEHARCCLCKQARTLGTTGFRAMRLDLCARAGALPPPRLAFILDDGRALAWFGQGRPYVVHPSFSDLRELHGLRGTLVHAA
jgi:hypothetical protein